MRQYLDKANADGKFDHNVNLIMCSYEGTATLGPTINPIHVNLQESYDFVTFALINRCYAHDLFDEECNDLYQDKNQIEALCNNIEGIADELDSCYIPIGYEFSGAELVSKDGLTRTQLWEVLRRCSKFRK